MSSEFRKILPGVDVPGCRIDGHSNNGKLPAPDERPGSLVRPNAHQAAEIPARKHGGWAENPGITRRDDESGLEPPPAQHGRQLARSNVKLVAQQDHDCVGSTG